MSVIANIPGAKIASVDVSFPSSGSLATQAIWTMPWPSGVTGDNFIVAKPYFGGSSLPVVMAGYYGPGIVWRNVSAAAVNWGANYKATLYYESF